MLVCTLNLKRPTFRAGDFVDIDLKVASSVGNFYIHFFFN